jgi:hypothetical protein
VPAIELEERHWLGYNFAFESDGARLLDQQVAIGPERGGEVYDSQSGFETHWRVIYASPEGRGFSPFAGFNYNYTKYTQTSSGVGNL